jgi:hypothetical protein
MGCGASKSEVSSVASSVENKKSSKKVEPALESETAQNLGDTQKNESTLDKISNSKLENTNNNLTDENNSLRNVADKSSESDHIVSEDKKNELPTISDHANSNPQISIINEKSDPQPKYLNENIPGYIPDEDENEIDHSDNFKNEEYPTTVGIPDSNCVENNEINNDKPQENSDQIIEDSIKTQEKIEQNSVDTGVPSFSQGDPKDHFVGRDKRPEAERLEQANKKESDQDSEEKNFVIQELPEAQESVGKTNSIVQSQTKNTTNTQIPVLLKDTRNEQSTLQNQQHQNNIKETSEKKNAEKNIQKSPYNKVEISKGIENTVFQRLLKTFSRQFSKENFLDNHKRKTAQVGKRNKGKEQFRTYINPNHRSNKELF